LLDSLLQEINMFLWILNTFVYLVGLIPLLIICLVVYRKVKKLQKPAIRLLMKPDWKKDVVYLCQFPVCPSVRTISPFALKLETWLRMNNIKYENVFVLKMGSKGQIPFIEFNGEEIPDSNVIINRLRPRLDRDPDSDCSSAERAMSHAATVMLENHTAIIGFYYRYGLKMKEFMSTLHLSEYFLGSKMAMFGFQNFLPYSIRIRSFMQGVSRHDHSEMWSMSNQDLKAISDWLGSNSYFHGSSPTTIDCTIFGHLAQFLYIDIGFPQKTYLESDCPNLIQLVGNIRQKYWPDWDMEIEKDRLIL